MTGSTAIGILGAGSWGTSLAVHLSTLGRPTVLWARSAELAEEMSRERRNPLYLPDTALPDGLEVTSDLADLHGCGIVIVVVPSHGFRSVVKSWLSSCPRSSSPVLVSATKGIEGGSLARMSEICRQEGELVDRSLPFAVLSGPSFARELVEGSPTAAVIASKDARVSEALREGLSGNNLRLYSSTDVIGVELGGSVKNVIAIAAGTVVGLGFGHNTRAALITRGLHEMTRFGVACGGSAATFSGLAGLGDLVLTCTSRQSRNQCLGEALAKGQSLAVLTGGTSMVAEGVRNSATVLDLARRHGIEMPITEQMVDVLYRGKTPRDAVEELMARSLKDELEAENGRVPDARGVS